MIDSQMFEPAVPKCPVHPRYQAKRKPRAGCGHCQYMWNVKTTGCGYGGRHGSAACCDHLGRCMGCELGTR